MAKSIDFTPPMRHAERLDDAEIFKRNTLRANRRRKIMAKILFAMMCVWAILVIIFAIWIYTVE